MRLICAGALAVSRITPVWSACADESEVCKSRLCCSRQIVGFSEAPAATLHASERSAHEFRITALALRLNTGAAIFASFQICKIRLL